MPGDRTESKLNLIDKKNIEQNSLELKNDGVK